MASPADEVTDPMVVVGRSGTRDGSSEETDGTVVGEGRSHSLLPDPLHLNVNVPRDRDDDDSFRELKSPSQAREERHRFDDELRLLQVEREITALGTLDEKDEDGIELQQSRSRGDSARRVRSRREDVIDDFDVSTNPLHERNQIYKPPEHPTTQVSKFFKRVHNSSFLVRYVTYITPVVLILLIPLLIGAFVPSARGKNEQGGARVGGVELFWFMIWLEIVWLSLWLGRIIAKLLPYPAGLIASLFTNNAKKWRDLVKQLELAATLFFWWLAIEISFLPTMTNHQSGGKTVQYWQRNMNKVLIACLVAAILNLVEKIIIQLIAISFHQRTYEDRIELNKFQIGSLVKLYTFSKVKLREVEDSEFEDPATRPGSGARTPGAILEKAQKNTKKAINHVGDFTGKIAGDFTGRAVKQSTHPSQVVITLLATTSGSQLLARRLYRTFKREETETVHQEDLTAAFENADECEAAFGMFDKDMNGDISMEELEAVCVEIGRERKAITASLKDLDSVVSKLDNVFMFVVFVIAILVLIALISSAAAAGLSNAGSVVLGLSWLFSATATEFLQSLIFVFVKHPFDVGDRITIYGQTGASYKGDDYFVKEIALLYTEFKKMEGHVVQAPNSYLNTLFILNMRRSGGLAEAVPMTFKFGTTIEQIDLLRTKLLDFVKSEKREYQANILTELRDVHEAHSISLNIVFFFKSNWQNELLRLQRRNKFICALMIAIQECGIEGPRMRYPGQKDTFPLYMQNIPFAPDMRGRGGDPDNPDGRHPEDTAFASEADGGARFSPSRDDRRQSISSHIGERASSIAARSTDGPRKRSESIAQQARRLDFSLGISEIASGDHAGDVYDMLTPARQRIPVNVRSTSQSQSQARRPSQARQSYDVGRSTSRSNPPAPGLILRSHTEGPRASTSVHRNRFFSRASRELPRLELDRMEAGMAGIPEADSANTGRIDPRTGLVSPMAVRLDTTDAFAPGASTTEQTLQAFPSSSTQNRVSFEESHGRKSMS